MSNLKQLDVMSLDDIFEMGSGYVLDFSDRTISIFFREELGSNIDDPKFRVNGTSKAKRLRCLLQTVDVSTAVRVVRALWAYREARRLRAGREDKVHDAEGRLNTIINRIEGKDGSRAAASPSQKQSSSALQSQPKPDNGTFRRLLDDMNRLAGLAPQPRGYAFEAFLKSSFDPFGLEAREPFRLRGEQIDGSFLLASETYLLEGKWQNAQADISVLHTFHGKVEQKAAWARGLIVSYSGFTEDGLHAFGRGKRVICMDGLDIHEALSRELPFDLVFEQKVRWAAERGSVFTRVRDLFPSR
jgi:hypothetical protein